MRSFVVFSLYYFVFSKLFLIVASWSYNALYVNWFFMPLFVACIYLSILRHRFPPLAADFCLSVIGVAVFMDAFSTLKNSMPKVINFWADPYIAMIDRIMHLGVDPWVIVHNLGGGLPSGIVEAIYLKLWILVAAGFPILVGTFDKNAVRCKSYLSIYLVSWVVIGNVFALIFLSVGPIYYDALLGGDTFAGLNDTFVQIGVADSFLGRIQSMLWFQYENGLSTLGSGISAFPSVHVSVAAVVACYLYDTFRRPLVTMLGVTYLCVILYLSVWVGWHYAVDGYVSIAVVLTARYFIFLKSMRPAKQDANTA